MAAPEALTPAPTTPPRRVLEIELSASDGPGEAGALEDFLTTVLSSPGVVSARRYRQVDAPAEAEADTASTPERWQCLLRFVLADHAAPGEPSLAQTLADAELTLRERWGAQLGIVSRWLEGDAAPRSGTLPRCRNCEAPVAGQYCWQCGQRVRERMITLGELIGGLTTDLFQFESRLWRSVRPLLLSPGRLTADYLAGRQARYMPPFRMYLVLSLAFFLLVTIGYGGGLVQVNSDGLTASAEFGTERWQASAGDRRDFAEQNCRFEDMVVVGPDWLRSYLTPERLRDRCLRIVERPEDYARRVLDTLPVSLLLTLPVLALAMKLLYPFSRRYYVEHLLFFVHYHSFLFLFVMLVLGASRLLVPLPVPGWITGVGVFAAWLYSLYYPYRAMRRVYDNGRLVTFLKYFMLLTTYLVLLVLLTVGTLVFTAMVV